MRYLCFAVSDGEEFVEGRVGMCAVEERGSWERGESGNQPAAVNTASTLRGIEQMFEREFESKFL
jgi:hypothetical protein